MLTAGVVYGVVMLIGYLVMLVAVAFGAAPMTEPTPPRVVFGVLMVLLWGGTIVAGLRALLSQYRRGRALTEWVALAAVEPSAPLAAAAARAGVSGPALQVADDDAYAFTYGIWRPRIVVSTGLVEAATADELVAVLHHEDCHVRNRDPLKVLALRTWTAAFFYLPVIGSLLTRILDRQELKADRAALRACGVSPVAGALLKAVGRPAAGRGTAVASLGGPALLDARITQLETGDGPPLPSAVTARTVLASAPGIGLIAMYGVLLYQVCLAVTVCCG
ncbi:M56 family metallopeptidase [Haloechinothrix halophila]|uniref:M56 family metallopeptidase n=1 Tax=Haloechinothrix halophila TaxID=1069073 RepID=UPI00146FA1DF|nr:M56 family metallopeptidase [Haloechinothrix halophila]